MGIVIFYWSCTPKTDVSTSRTSTPTERPTQDSPRDRDINPLPEIVDAVKRYQEVDRDASFSYFNGHVDNFATSAKNTIPQYAMATLKKLGLPTKAQKPMKLAKPRSSKQQTKPGNKLDSNLKQKLPYVLETDSPSSPSKGSNDGIDKANDEKPKRENRTEPSPNPHKMLKWDRPNDEELRLERRAAEPILQAFLKEHKQLFRIDADAFKGSMKFKNYQRGAYFRKAIYTQQYGGKEKILYGKTLVHFDVNWNVIGISRMIISPEKLKYTVPEKIISKDEAIAKARSAFGKECAEKKSRALFAEAAIDPVRRQKVWHVQMLSEDGNCHWTSVLDAESGRVLNTTDEIDHAYTDASVNRWYYSNGDLYNPAQIVSTNQYTRNDRRLEHDFFYVMNDHRCEGNPESTCSETGHTGDTWCDEAHGTTNGPSYIRATRRTSRDFDNYYPGGSSETFGETNAYYWSRWFCQWLKPTLDALGVLPNSASNYPRVLIITNACRSGSVHNSSYSITTDNNKGEGTNVIRLAHRDPGDNSNDNAACQGGGCFDNPSNLHHELNHFFLKRYFDVGSGLDCSAGLQLKFTHEGALGTAVPHAYWHNYYDVGYNPSSTDQLYFSSSNIGRVHTSNSNLMTLTDYYCVDNEDDPYRAGRVVGQALWKFYHGTTVNGSTFGNTWYPSTDTDFATLIYWAAELQSGSTYKDRYEYANRIMEILDLHSNWSSSGKQEYCDIFDLHNLDVRINPNYCN
ncbi:MAG: hypothetical protein AAFP19_15805 [Bacteroidota bacterium]